MLQAALPRLGLSFGPVTASWILLTAGRWFIIVTLALIIRIYQIFRPPSSPRRNRNLALAFLLFVNLGLVAAEIDAFYFEPFNLQTTHLHLDSGHPLNARPLRIAHLSDLHIERITRRERQLIQQVNELQPDLILMTGDYPNVDYTNDHQALTETRQVLASLHAPYGVYAVSGSPGVDTPSVLKSIFSGLDIHLLDDEVQRINLPQGGILIIGVSTQQWDRDAATLDRLAKQAAPQDYTILLYHSPDLADAAAVNQVDLYLGGHTHGGQLRLPLYGAIVTLSRYGKKYESGLYHVGSTSMYITRGIGMEGLNLPRFRFFCPPEIVIIELE